MTPQVRAFLEQHKDKLTGRILEVGSSYVNGSVREVVPVSVGIDIRNGRGVDLICSASDLMKHFEPGSFDSCVSTETLEHVEDWKGFITNTWEVVREGGYIVCTMASKYKKRHAYPDDYWRFELDDIRRIYPRAEVVCELPGKKAPVSIGWVVRKYGGLGELNFDPLRVK